MPVIYCTSLLGMWFSQKETWKRGK